MWKSILSYTSVLSLAAQSSRWEQAMNEKLQEMTKAAEQAAMMTSMAQKENSLALKSSELASSEKSQAMKMKEEATVLFEKAQADAAISTELKTNADILEGEAVMEEEEASVHAATVVVEEIEFDSEMTEATSDAAQAARSEAQVHGEEMGMGICEFVPGLDMLCSIVGGITAIGMEGVAAGEAAKATSEFAMAAATKAEEEREGALVAELQAKAAEDHASAVDLYAEEVTEQEVAEEERLAGEEKETEAEALLEEAEHEEASAGEHEATAMEEEEESGSLASKSIRKGVLACWDALLSAFFGTIAFLFFSFKVMVKTGYRICTVSSSTAPTSKHRWRNMSYNVHHCVLVALVLGIFSKALRGFDILSLQARGGIVLGFGMTGGVIQTMCLHFLSKYLHDQQWSQILHVASRSVIALSVLYMLEILILWASFGLRIFMSSWLHDLHHWIWWVIFSVPLGVHVVFLEIPFLREKEMAYTHKDHLNSSRSRHPNELQSLLPTQTMEKVSSRCETKEVPSKTWFQYLQEDLAEMHIPFEILLVACMASLLVHCMNATIQLWPASKALLMTMKPAWLATVATISGLVFIIYVAISIKYKSWKE